MSKLILADTMPSAGEGVQRSGHADVSEVAGAEDVTLETFKTLFFLRNWEGLTAAEQGVVGFFFLSDQRGTCNFADTRLHSLHLPATVTEASILGPWRKVKSFGKRRTCVEGKRKRIWRSMLPCGLYP
jgi:hypothetical protein